MKTNLELVEYAKQKLNSDTIYCLGTYGQTLTQAVLNQKCSQYSWNNSHKTRISMGLGRQAFDCCGLIKGFLWTNNGILNYDSSTDENEAMMLSRATVKGKISTLPEVIGALVFMSGHVGIYIGNDEVIECSPYQNKYAVIKTPLKGRGWTDWAYYNRISYSSTQNTTTSINTSNSNNNAQTSSKTVIHDIQNWYNANYNYLGTISVDGSFGPDTKKHLIMALQQEMNAQYGASLNRDGSFGPFSKSAFKDLKLGCKGNITRICQAFLYKKGYDPNGFDGIFGNGMSSAVNKFQRDNGLRTDSILGPNTAYKLFN